MGIYYFSQPGDAPATESVKVKPQGGPPPHNVGKVRALQYKAMPDVITTYVLLDANYHTPPRELVASEWEYFGKVVATEELGSLLSRSGTLIKVTVQKDPIWSEWEPTE